MRRLLLAVPVLFTLIACAKDHETENACEPITAGATNLDATCSAPPVASTEAVEAFRSHTIRTSSAAGGVTRLADGAVNAVMDCVAQAMASVLVPVLSAAVTGETKTYPVDCTNEFQAKGVATFDNGTYTFHGEERGGKIDGFVVDSEASSTLRLYLTRDAGTFHKGDLVTVDVLDLNTFLVGSHVVADAKGNAEIAYDHTGPLVEVLGKGATPPNPLPITDDLRTSLASAFEVEGAVHSDIADCSGGYHTVADQTIPRSPVNADIKPVLVSAVTRGPSGQVVTAKVWDATYAPSAPGIPTGHIDADVAGIPGVAHARVDFDDPTGFDGTLTLICQ